MLIGPSQASVVALSGADRHRYLHDVTTQRFDDVSDGDLRSTLVLDAHGAPLAAFDVLVADERDLLIVPRASVEHVMEVLARRTFLADARFEPTDDVVCSLRADDLDGVPDVDVEVGRWAQRDGVRIARHRFGIEFVGPPAAVEGRVARLESAGAERVDEQTMEDARVALGEPVAGREIVPPHLPEELGLLPSHVHLAKGCYPGQEAVARMWMLGRPRRRLARIGWTGQVTPGMELGEGRQRVQVTATSAGEDRGLAFVPADATVGDRFAATDVEVVVTGFVGGDETPPGHDPNVVRRRDRKSAAGR